MSLKTGEARERTSLWSRKSRLGGPRARRMISASGASNFSSFDIVAASTREEGGLGVLGASSYICFKVWRSPTM